MNAIYSFAVDARRVLLGAFACALFSELAISQNVGEEAVVLAIKKLGGKVLRDSKKANVVVGVDLGESSVSDKDLQQLKAFTNLELLVLKDTSISNDGLAVLRAFKSL